MDLDDDLWDSYSKLWENTSDPIEKWQIIVKMAKTKPHMFIGNPDLAHFRAISDAIRVVKYGSAFGAIKNINLYLTQNQYIFSCQAEALQESISEVMNWSSHDLFIEAFFDAQRRYHAHQIIGIEAIKHFEGASPPDFISAFFPVYVSPAFFMGIRTQDGFWYQAYTNGQPIQQLNCLNVNSPISFIVAAFVTSDWFSGLPYSDDSLKEEIGPELIERVKITWLDDNNIFSSAPVTNSEVTKLLESVS